VQVSLAGRRRVDDLAAAVVDADTVRKPLDRQPTGHRHRSSRPAALRGSEFGPTAGENIAVTNAGSWHDAGITGGVKVGIVDFFDLTLWNAAEHGPRRARLNGHLLLPRHERRDPRLLPDRDRWREQR
jgi:hypothetical protein